MAWQTLSRLPSTQSASNTSAHDLSNTIFSDETDIAPSDKKQCLRRSNIPVHLGLRHLPASSYLSSPPRSELGSIKTQETSISFSKKVILVTTTTLCRTAICNLGPDELIIIINNASLCRVAIWAKMIYAGLQSGPWRSMPDCNYGHDETATKLLFPVLYAGPQKSGPWWDSYKITLSCTLCRIYLKSGPRWDSFYPIFTYTIQYIHIHRT